MIPTLPLRARNTLAHLILEAVHDAGARRELDALASGAPPAWLDDGDEHAARLRTRARAAANALRACPARHAESPDDALDAAALLFDAGLGFEVHEMLEPWWVAAEGRARDALQGLIQIAVGYQHRANGNIAGARSLLTEGAARLRRSGLDGLETHAFAEAVAATADASQTRIPGFPRRTRGENTE